MATTPGNSIGETTTGIVGFTGTAFVGSAATQHAVQIGSTTSSTLASVSVGTTGQVFQANTTADPTWSTATYPSTATGTGKILRANGTNWVATTATFPDTAGTSGNVLTSDGTNWSSSAASGPGGLTLTTSVTLTSAQIKALHGTPVEVIPAQGTGKVVVVISGISKFTYGGTNVFIAGAGSTQRVSLYYGTAIDASGGSSKGLISNANIVSASSLYQTFNAFADANTATLAQFENTALNAYNLSATEITGNAGNNNTVHIAVMYYVVTL